MEKEKGTGQVDLKGNWLEDLDPESLKRSIEVGEIYPKLNIPPIPEGMESGKVVRVQILENEPKRVESEKFKFGKVAFVIPVLNLEDEITYSFWLPRSAKFKLAVLFRQYKTLKGLKIGVWKEKAELEKYPKATVYNIQLLETP